MMCYMMMGGLMALGRPQSRCALVTSWPISFALVLTSFAPIERHGALSFRLFQPHRKKNFEQDFLFFEQDFLSDPPVVSS
jgi:hypothetical protein